MPTSKTTFTTIRTEGALLPPDLLQRIAEGATIDGLTPDSYHRPGEKLNEVINRSWNALQGAWASFQSAQALLPTGDLGTTLTRERWLLPLFRELDYGRLQTANAVEIDGRSYPISHGWEQVAIHLVSYQVKLDERTARVAGAASASPHSLLQVFLNRSDAHTWGFLSNGLKLRILRDNASLTRQAYVEFDLEAMMAGEVYSDFVLLWLLAHQSRVEGGRDCWLEKWMKTAEEQGTRALDQLRDGVQRAIEALGVGFIERPENAGLRDKLASGSLDKQDYYRQLLRLVYRLLFLFVAEDRGLLYDPETSEASREIYRKYYSTQRLRRMAESFKGTNHIDLFEGLRLTMHMLEGAVTTANGQQRTLGAQRLGLPVLGSFLFRDEAVADLIDCKISNRNLLKAVRALALVYDERVKAYRSIDYKNLGPEELGSVYESLLEQHPIISVPARTFVLTLAAGNERKTTGSYYTPSSLISALLDSALDPVLEEAVYGEGGRARRASPLPDAAERILALKVCDPACGSGHFLIAAANRIAKALASIRTGEEEPPPSAILQAKRDVIGHCIYGVDINPMAVELCKVNLWMEALEPGKPLSFLDHRIQVGNSLLGTTPRLMAEGIPSDAFNPIEGDDKAVVSKLRKQNAQERKDYEHGQGVLWDVIEPPADYRRMAADLRDLDALDDATLAGIRAKEERYRDLANDEEYQKARGLADAWCAAFVWEKRDLTNLTPNPSPLRREGDSRTAQGDMVIPPPLTDRAYRLLREKPLDPRFEAVRVYIERLRERYQFFHWHVTFPAVFPVPDDPKDAANEQTGWDGGFDVVLGNPPWERIKIQEKEWFAERVPDIAEAPNAAARKRMIDELEAHFPEIHAEFQADLRKAEGESHFVRVSGRFPLCGRGDVNTYTIFAETTRQMIGGAGRVGMIVPSGIATDDTTKFFFQDLMRTESLASLYDFENRDGIFPGVHRSYKFCLLTMSGADRPAQRGAEFVFFALNVGDLADADKRFTLSAGDIALLNPNTGTTATFRSKRDAEITKAIYRRVPVLIREEPLENEWGIRFATMFHMSNDSGLFRTREQLEAEGGQLDGNHFMVGGTRYLPLYEGKMFMPFDHRYADVVITENILRAGQAELTSREDKLDADFVVMPRSWVEQKEVSAKLGNYGLNWFIGFKNVTAPTNERTFLATILPLSAVGNSIPLAFIDEQKPNQIIAFGANLTIFAFDYLARQKMGNVNLNFYIVQQLSVIPPHTYTPTLLEFIMPRVLELTYTAWDLQPFAQDIGYGGAPFVWDEQRRFLMRCELDALYFHLYQIARDDADYILETFPIVKRKDEAAHDEYLTKRIILEMYDQMAALPTISVPAPKDATAAYLVPDVSQWQTWLTPEPASPGAAHGVKDDNP